MRTRQWVTLAVMTAALSLCRSAIAATITWTGAAGTNSWHAAANWDLNRVPAVGDDVVIPSMSPDVTVTHSTGSTSVNSLISAEAFALIGGTLALNSTSTLNGAFNFSGTLSGSGDVTVNGAMTWTGNGTMSGTGKTIIAPTASLAITDFFQKTLSRTLENHSANMSWTPGSVANINFNNGTISNMADGTFTATLGNNSLFSFAGTGGTNAFTNAGTFNKLGNGTLNFTTTVNAPVLLNNSGTTHLVAGGLTISNGGANTGTIDADAGTTLALASTVTLDPASSLSGQGTLTFTGGQPNTVACTLTTDRVININSVVIFNAAYTMTGTVNLAGTLTGSGDITVTGVMNWTGTGTMSGTGKTIIAPPGSLAISDFFQKTISRTLENHSANMSWTPGSAANINFNNGTISNMADGTFTANLGNNSLFNFAGVGGTNAFNNAGTFNKLGNGTLELSSVFGFPVPFNNTGTTNLDGGGLRITSGGSNTGTIDADGGSTLTLASAVTLDPSSSLTGTGTLTFTGGAANTVACHLTTDRIINILAGTVSFNAPYTIWGTLNLTGGTLNGSGDITVAGMMNWTGPTMSGTGKTIIAPGGALSISGLTQKFLSRTLENHSTSMTWSAAAGASFNFNNGTLHNAADGVFVANVGTSIQVFSQGGVNAFVNDGLFQKTGSSPLTFGTFTTGIPTTNNGTIRVSDGILSLLALTNENANTLNGGIFEIAGTLRYTGANIITNAASIILDGPGSAIQTTSGANALTNFATNSAGGTLELRNGRNFSLAGGFNNAGLVTFGAGDNTFSAATMANSGTILKTGTGAGSANATVTQQSGGTVDVRGGILTLATLTNLSGTTLTGGNYFASDTLRIANANITSLAANVVLDGPASAIENSLAIDALTGLTNVAAGGAIQIKNGRNLNLAGDLNNAGQVTIGPGDCTVGLPGAYIQTAGGTQLSGGTLDPAGVTSIQGGELAGSGTVDGNVLNAGAIRPTDIVITGDYQQLVQGSLIETISGTNGGTDYGRVSVTGTALLAGTLDLSLSNYVPAIGDVFENLTANLVEVKFSTIRAPVLPGLKGWSYSSDRDSLQVTVIDCGPGDADGDGVGDACDTTPDLSWHTIAGGGGTSSGGIFKLSATIGQHDANEPDAPMAGGEFTLVGGFWAGVEPRLETACALVGDMNADGLRNGIDVRLFAGCLIDGGGDCACADINDSGAADSADVSPFVQLLINQ